MPNILDATGLTLKTRDELLTYFNTGYESIYGSDINLGQSTPDGQQINLLIQAILDDEDIVAQINAGFDPDQAIGAVLDQRVGINGIQRLGGTYTITNITVVTDRALNLPGLDDQIANPDGTGYTVADNAGNKWILTASQVIGAPGTYVFAFRAQNNGAILTVPNTITVPVTIILGVTSVNNPTIYTTLGIDQETDAQLRLRRQQSVSLSAQGYHDALVAALLNINGVTFTKVYENVTGSVDGDGIPGHSIWVIVDGTGSNADIGNAIYKKRNAGAGMKGSVTATITQLDGTFFVVRWDIVTPQNLFMQFTVTSINGIDPVVPADLKTGIVDLLRPGVFESVNINELATIVQEIDPNALVVPTAGDGFALTAFGPFVNVLTPTAKNNRFAISGANIAITVV